MDGDVGPELPVGGILHHAVDGLEQLHHGQVLHRNTEMSHPFPSVPPPVCASSYLRFCHLDGNVLDLQMKVCLWRFQLQLSVWVDAHLSRGEDWLENFGEKHI